MSRSGRGFKKQVKHYRRGQYSKSIFGSSQVPQWLEQKPHQMVLKHMESPVELQRARCIALHIWLPRKGIDYMYSQCGCILPGSLDYMYGKCLDSISEKIIKKI